MLGLVSRLHHRNVLVSTQTLASKSNSAFLRSLTCALAPFLTALLLILCCS